IRTLRFFTSIPLPSPDCRQKPLRTLILAGAGERRQSSASCADGCSDRRFLYTSRASIPLPSRAISI
ncbi:hypothetical protein, partial [Paenibacillus sp. Marseille-Q4541]|uniref:hypothetical protein n=1 Tax=Paenibacillus sp. Marseille-Q4541 TaxID=2831522 RepID=UPI001BADE3D3